ncbi:MAG: quinone-interacting membrane-bound oxidoreductase complex subunit QmoC, partial [Taibaiella sp.]|nr:quinone-interacting membrane-bound oxidoreductase complex subunit QmoC [Taibaiella sp.]
MKQHGGETMKKCFQCATCTVACALSPKEYAFPRKEMINAGWGQKDKLMGDPDIWLCHGCMDCSRQCPRGARPADLMGAVRSYIYRSFAVPAFMGKALASPKYLPVLFLFAALAILLLVVATNAIFHGLDGNFFAVRDGVIKYEDFIHKLVIEGFFIPGNLFIFALAGISFYNYWNHLDKTNGWKPKMSFVSAVVRTAIDFFTHKKFDKCPANSNRYYGHIYAFYGFLGTMIATGLVVVGEIYHYGHMFHSDFMMAVSFYLPYPMNLVHPVKILGMVSGVFLFLGLLMFLLKRIKQDEQEGKSTYNDWLFLWVLLGVAFTGLGIVLIRMIVPLDMAFLAYITY